jgi:peptidyl-prolyl cis-trans isomerase B (cyclophilin B)
VLQCGDPTATGTGGPGYEFDDELTGQETYQAGVVAMANAGPNTNGSQFFIVYDDSQLNPNYTVFGRVTNGLDVVQGIAAQGVAGGGTDGAPANQVTIRSVTIG